MKTSYLLFLVFILNYSFGIQYTSAQFSDKVAIDSVLIIAEKETINFQEEIFDIDKNIYHSGSTISEVLLQQSNTYLKKYGQGQLASISLNGFNAVHTDIRWNGIKINSPMLGQTDLNTLHIGTNNFLSITDQNTDNLSGSLSLEQKFHYKDQNHLTFHASVGSFKNSSGFLSYLFSNSRLYSNTLVSYQGAKNDFSYKSPLFLNETVKQINAETKQLNVEKIFGYKLNARNQIKIFGKFFMSDRNIAPTIFETNGLQNQKDKMALGKIEWAHHYLNIKTTLNSAFIYQDMIYQFSPSNSAVKSKATSWQNNFSIRADFKENFRYIGTLSHELETGFSDHYSKLQKRNRIKLDNEVVYYVSYFSSSIGFSEVLIANKLSPFLPKAKIEFTLYDLPANFKIGVDYSAKVRFPTLNELYWIPGGNEDLKTENSQNLKLLIFLSRKMKTVKFENRFEYFSIWANQFIQWKPSTNIYWIPENIGAVYSRGFNNHLSTAITFKKDISLDLSLNYSFTRTTKTKQTEQLLYVPFTQVNLNTQLNSKWINFAFNHHYTSIRFANENNTIPLNKYYLLDFYANKTFQFKNKDELTLGAQLNNITNQTYYTVINRPLPGFNFNFSVKYQLNFRK